MRPRATDGWTVPKCWSRVECRFKNPLAHVALILKRNLLSQGFVEGKLLHVRGNGRRKLGYMVTPAGYQAVNGKYF